MPWGSAGVPAPQEEVTRAWEATVATETARVMAIRATEASAQQAVIA
jgi:hypothetical protein